MLSKGIDDAKGIDNELNQMYGKESESKNKIVKAIKLTDNIFSIGLKKAVLINEDAIDWSGY